MSKKWKSFIKKHYNKNTKKEIMDFLERRNKNLEENMDNWHNREDED